MEPVNPTDTTRSYLDFEGLGQLRGQARKDGKAALRETAQHFEGMFLQMMLKSMREATVKSDLVESSGAETFEAMFDKEVSVQLAKRNMMGVADMLVQNQSRQMSPPPSTDEMLKSRDTAAKGFPLNQPGKAYPLDAAGPVLNPLKLPGGPFALPKMNDMSPRSKP
jgi:Rod binding domain-containing protein